MTASSSTALALLALLAATTPGQAAIGPDDDPAAVATETARVALRSRQFAAAARALEGPADQGDPQARYLLGVLLESGYLGEAQTGAARRWLRLAAEQRHAAAAFALAASLATRVPTDGEEARRWLGHAAALGYPMAQELVRQGRLPYSPRRPGPDVTADVRRSFALWAATSANVTDLATTPREEIKALRDDQGRTLLAIAADRGRSTMVEWLIGIGVDCNVPDRAGLTALMLSARQPDTATTAALLRAGAHIAAVDAAGRTALMHAAWSDQAAQISMLAGAGAALDAVDTRGWTALDIALQRERPKAVAALRALAAPTGARSPLLRAAARVDPARTGRLYEGWPELLVAVSRDDPQAVQRALAAGRGTELRSPQGYRALDVAAEFSATQVVPLLLAAGHDPLATAAGGESPVARAARRRDLRLLERLDERGAVHAAPQNLRSELLIAAVLRGHGDVVAWLLARGASASARNADGTPVVALAVAAADQGTLRGLLAAGADVNAVDARGRSALWHAAAIGDVDSLQILLAAGAARDRADAHGTTPLMAAVRAGRLAAVEALLAAGASPSLADRAGDTALHVAAATGQTAAAQRLARERAILDRSNAAGDTPLIVAARNGHAEICAALLRAGADRRPRNRDRLTAQDVAELRGFATLAKAIAAR